MELLIEHMTKGRDNSGQQRSPRHAIHQEEMPLVADFCTFRLIDVSSFKELLRRMAPNSFRSTRGATTPLSQMLKRASQGSSSTSRTTSGWSRSDSDLSSVSLGDRPPCSPSSSPARRRPPSPRRSQIVSHTLSRKYRSWLTVMIPPSNSANAVSGASFASVWSGSSARRGAACCSPRGGGGGARAGPLAPAQPAQLGRDHLLRELELPEQGPEAPYSAPGLQPLDLLDGGDQSRVGGVGKPICTPVRPPAPPSPDPRSPVMSLSRVVFPAPFGPITPIFCPLGR